MKRMNEYKSHISPSPIGYASRISRLCYRFVTLTWQGIRIDRMGRLQLHGGRSAEVELLSVPHLHPLRSEISISAPVNYAHLAAYRAKNHILSKNVSSSITYSSGGGGNMILTSQYVGAVKVLDALHTAMYFV